jgi:hypothetical protein
MIGVKRRNVVEGVSERGYQSYKCTMPPLKQPIYRENARPTPPLSLTPVSGWLHPRSRSFLLLFNVNIQNITTKHPLLKVCTGSWGLNLGRSRFRSDFRSNWQKRLETFKLCRNIHASRNMSACLIASTDMSCTSKTHPSLWLLCLRISIKKFDPCSSKCS